MTTLNHLIRSILYSLASDDQDSAEQLLDELCDKFGDTNSTICDAMHEFITAYSTNSPNNFGRVVTMILENSVPWALDQDPRIRETLDEMDLLDVIEVICGALC